MGCTASVKSVTKSNLIKSEMEKGRSLRLKRKVGSKANPQTSKILKINQTTAPDKPVIKVQAIVLSSDSDEEESQLTKNPSKQRNGESIKGLAEVKVGFGEDPSPRNGSRCERDFARFYDISREFKESELREGQDRSLQKLKDLIYKLSSSDSLGPKSLTPFPPHPQVSEVSVPSRDETSDHEGRLHQTSKPLVPEQLSPFPKYCDTCRKMDVCNNKLDCNMSNIKNSGASVKADVSSVILPKSVAQTVRNGNKKFVMEKQDIFASHNQPSSKLPSVSITRQIADRAEIDNSHLMRDRNSNLYSLQSRNRQTFPQSGADNSIKANNDNAQNPVPPSAAELRSTSHTIFTHDQQQTSGSAGVVSSKSAQDSKGAYSSKFAQRSPGCKFLEQHATESHSRDHSITLPHNLHEKSIDETVHKNMSSIAGSVAEGIENDQSAARNQKNDNRNHIQDRTIGNKVEKELCGNQTNDNRNHIQDRTIGNKVEKELGGNQSSNKRGPALQSCPMCQMMFASGTSQLDIDSHLASCLSTADDDFMW